MMAPLMVLPYIMRVLGAENYGKIAYAESFISYFVLLATLGITNYAQRECAVLMDNSELLKKKASQAFAISLIFTLLSIAIYFLFPVFLPNICGEFTLMVVFSLMIFGSGLQMEWLYVAQERFDLISIREIFSKVLYIGLSFVLIQSSSDYILFGGIVVFCTTLFQFIWNQIGIARGECGVRPSLAYSSGWSFCIKPILFMALVTIGSKLFTDSDVIMIKIITSDNSDVAVGLYNSATILPKALDTLLMAIAAVITPRLFIAVRNLNEKDVMSLLDKTSNILFFICVPAILTCLFFSEELLWLFAGPEYVSAATTLSIYSFIMMGVLIITLAGTRMYLARQKEKKLFYILCGGAILNIILNYVLINVNGIEGAAIATLLSYAIIMTLEMSLEHTWHYIFSKDKLKYIVGAIVISITFFAVKNTISQPLPMLISAILIAGSLYFLTLYFLHEYSVFKIITTVKSKFK